MADTPQPLSLEQEAALLVASRHQQRLDEQALACRLESFTNGEVLSLLRAGALIDVLGGYAITRTGKRCLRTGLISR